MILTLDFETFSRVPIKKVSTSRYVKDPSTEILMLGWAVDDHPVQLWEPHKEPLPAELEALLRGPSVELHAFNVPFERGIIEQKLGIHTPIERWRDSQVEALALSFPAKLDQVLEAIGLQKKDPRGARLIELFCSPAPRNHKADRYDWTNKPLEWEEFKEYCIRDVEVERILHHWLSRYNNMSEEEWQLWYLDQRINQIGLPVDTGLAHHALSLWRKEKREYLRRLREITGLERVTRGPFLDWLKAQGVEIDNTRKDTLRDLLVSSQGLSESVREALQLWSWKEVRAIDKYQAVLDSVEWDQRVRGVFQFAGASRTRRWAGRVIQPHNLKSTITQGDDTAGTIEQVDRLCSIIEQERADLLHDHWPQHAVADLLGSAIRHVIKARDGYHLDVCDLSSIESVVLAWITGCSRVLEVFREGRDPYKDFATELFHVPYDQVTKAQRKFSKPPVLGCGYRLGWRGLINYAESMGVQMGEQEAQHAVETFRNMYWEIPRFWEWIGSAMNAAIAGQVVEGYRMRLYRDDKFVYITLPSGRRLAYFEPEVLPHPAPWGDVIPTISYMGLDDRNQWVRLYAHDGLITENIIQAIARDVLAHGMRLCAHHGINIIGHVHDELIAENPDDGVDYLERMNWCMTQRPQWASDLLLRAAGYTARRYMKD